MTRPLAEAVGGVRVLTLGSHAELERQNLAVRDLAGATGDRLPHLGLYRGEDGLSLLRQRVAGREPVITLADRLAEDAARPEQAAATIDALLRLRLARWHFELARPPEPAELALGQLLSAEAAEPDWRAVEHELGAPRWRPRSPRRASRSPTSSGRSASSPSTSSARCSARYTAGWGAPACSSTATAGWSSRASATPGSAGARSTSSRSSAR